MSNEASFNEILEAVDHLPPDQQADLVDVVRKRIAARERKLLVEDVKAARADHRDGKTTTTSVDDLMREIAP